MLNSRQFQELRKSGPATIRRRGCLRYRLLLKKWRWESILQKFTKNRNFIGLIVYYSLRLIYLDTFIWCFWPYIVVGFRRNKALIDELSTPRPGTKDLHFATQFSQPFLTQCVACLWKQHWSYWRNPLYSAVRIIYTTFLALIFGSMFWDIGQKK